MIKLNLITGFLGAGKTTLLQEILRTGIPGEKVALIVNEFGDVGIDGRILKRDGLDMIELANGCVCCQIQGDFHDALVSLCEKVAPDRILIEASGVSEPGKLLGVLYHSAKLKDMILVEPTLCVVDVSAFPNLFGVFAYHYVCQIKTSDLILLNKTDLCDEATLERVEAQIRSIHPRAFLVKTKFCQIDLSTILNEKNLPPSETKHDEAEHHPNHPETLPFTSFTFSDPTFQTSQDILEAFLRKLPKDVFRVKGFVRLREGMFLLQYATGTFSLKPLSNPDIQTTEIVFIGNDLKREEILKDLAVDPS